VVGTGDKAVVEPVDDKTARDLPPLAPVAATDRILVGVLVVLVVVPSPRGRREPEVVHRL
jgi:hypothetical protein